MFRTLIDPQRFIREVYPGAENKALRISIRENALYIRGGFGADLADGSLARTTVPGYVLGIATAAWIVGDTAVRDRYL